MRLSATQFAMLAKAAAGADLYAGIHGRSAHGGATGTLSSLQRRGLLCGIEITELGRKVLAEHERRGTA
ncbi:hypothetical protein [Alcanivorax sp. 1008]|uniref:hypothetical protein n=1 Tax=Alcanivorax sp. 1008 TaxID=2816853 RepID=UPI001E0EA576|nr:hypothetical protein [Alcanivorax sp. 1008]MCC1496841.1 hypothetical protein [Alcanivorax sp. 1008]